MRHRETSRDKIKQTDTKSNSQSSFFPPPSNVYDRNTYIDIDFRFMFRYNR